MTRPQSTRGPDTDFTGHLARSLKRQWKRYRRALKQCQRKFSEESVHNSRIETRRLLSFLELMTAFWSAARLRRARRLLKRHLDTFSDLRDTQVQRLHVAELLPKLPDLEVFERALRKHERRCIKKARRRIKRFRLAELKRELKRLRAGLKELDGPALRRRCLQAVRRAFAEVAKRRRAVQPEHTLTIHRTRVAFKHFRYMVEGLRGAWPGITDQRLRAMQAYQGLMGEIQDAEVLLVRLRAFVRAERIKPGLARPWFLEIERRRRMRVARYLRRADELSAFRPPPVLAGS